MSFGLKGNVGRIVRNAGLSIALIASFPGVASADVVSLAAIDDALVNSTKPANVYGLTHYLSVYYDGIAYNRSYLKFDLSAIPDSAVVTSAHLRLFAFANNGFALPSVAVKLVANDNWSEATLSWNNRPAAGATLATSTPVINAWQDFDLLTGGTWNYSTDLADNLLSLALTEGEAFSSTVKQVWYSPAEQLTYPLLPPELDITWTAVPEPGTLWLFAIAALACGFSARRITIQRRTCSPYAHWIPRSPEALALS